MSQLLSFQGARLRHSPTAHRHESTAGAGITAELLRTAANWARALNEGELAQVCSEVREHRVRAGYYVARRGERATSWMGLASGVVQLSVGSEDGRLSSLINVSAGDWFDEASLVSERGRAYDAIAARDTRLLLVPEHIFRKLLAENPAFNRHVMGLMARRTEALLEALEGERLCDSEQRVARCLASIFDSRGEEAGMRAPVQLTQSEIGLLAGVSRQRTNATLHRLAQQGILQWSKLGTKVLDMEGLRAFGGLPRAAPARGAIHWQQEAALAREAG